MSRRCHAICARKPPLMGHAEWLAVLPRPSIIDGTFEHRHAARGWGYFKPSPASLAMREKQWRCPGCQDPEFGSRPDGHTLPHSGERVAPHGNM